MTEYFEIVLTAIVTGMGTGVGVSIGVYLATKGLIQNLERLVAVVKKNGDKKEEVT